MDGNETKSKEQGSQDGRRIKGRGTSEDCVWDRSKGSRVPLTTCLTLFTPHLPLLIVWSRFQDVCCERPGAVTACVVPGSLVQLQQACRREEAHPHPLTWLEEDLWAALACVCLPSWWSLLPVLQGTGLLSSCSPRS